MAKLNLGAKRAVAYTHEGAKTVATNPEEQLRRLTMAHLLWEDTFYVDGKDAASVLAKAVHNVKPEVAARLAIEARTKFNLRHVPLFIVREMARDEKQKHLVGETLAAVIQRPDELAEFLAIYWKGDKGPNRQALSNQVKKGLAAAFTKFNEYQLAKYNRDGEVKLRDVLFLCHAKPKDEAQGALWKRLVDGTLATPDTWETRLSAGEAKGRAFEELIDSKKLGGLALLRNLRNMKEAETPTDKVFGALQTANFSRVLPFRFVAAAMAVPQWEPEIEQAMLKTCAEMERLSGKTAVVVDNSGSMITPKISAKSELTRIDAACALAILVREVCENAVVISYSTRPHLVPPRRGFALRDAIKSACDPNSTNTQDAVMKAAQEGYDRIIVVTDEQSHQRVSNPLVGTKGYIINVANYNNGIGYDSGWTHITGWSEAIVQYIQESERGE